MCSMSKRRTKSDMVRPAAEAAASISIRSGVATRIAIRSERSVFFGIARLISKPNCWTMFTTARICQQRTGRDHQSNVPIAHNAARRLRRAPPMRVPRPRHSGSARSRKPRPASPARPHATSRSDRREQQFRFSEARRCGDRACTIFGRRPFSTPPRVPGGLLSRFPRIPERSWSSRARRTDYETAAADGWMFARSMT